MSYLIDDVAGKLIRKQITVQEAIGLSGSQRRLADRVQSRGCLRLAERVKRHGHNSRGSTKRLARFAPRHDWLT